MVTRHSVSMGIYLAVYMYKKFLPTLFHGKFPFRGKDEIMCQGYGIVRYTMGLSMVWLAVNANCH